MTLCFHIEEYLESDLSWKGRILWVDNCLCSLRFESWHSLGAVLSVKSIDIWMAVSLCLIWTIWKECSSWNFEGWSILFFSIKNYFLRGLDDWMWAFESDYSSTFFVVVFFSLLVHWLIGFEIVNFYLAFIYISYLLDYLILAIKFLFKKKNLLSLFNHVV